MTPVGRHTPQDPGSLQVEPNPVEAGKEVEVKYDGDGTVFVQIDAGEWQVVDIDPRTGAGKVDVPLGASVLIFSDRTETPSEAIVEVIETS